MRVMFVGGGTGGHFFPLMAVAEALTAGPAPSGGDPELYYIGPEPYDRESLAAYGITYVYCPAGKRRKYFSIKNFFDFWKNITGIFFALGKLFVIYPDVLLSKGGYTSVPVVIAAWLLRIPIIVHESDAVPGSANKLARHFARYVAIAYDSAAEFFPKEKTALVGIPTRDTLLRPLAGDQRLALGITDNAPILLILGGSQGAERVNALILDSLDELLPNFNVIHQIGSARYESTVAAAKSLIEAQVLSRYRPVPFLEAAVLHQAMTAADVIISRAGSTSIHEIALHGKPSILIPIPEEISHDQRTNAYMYARTGAATVMEEENLTDGLLTAEIARIISDRQVHGAMSTAARSFAIPDAAEKLSAVIRQIGIEHE